MKYSLSKFLEYFLINKIIDQNVFAELQMELLKTNLDSEDFLLKKHLVNEVQIGKAQAYALGVEFIELNALAANPQALNLVPEVLAKEHSLIPFDYDPKNEILKVAMIDPLNLDVISFLEKRTNRKIMPFLAIKSDIEDAIRIHYHETISPTVNNALNEYGDNKQTVNFADNKATVVREPPIAKLVNTILEFAVKGRASDVHIEPQENKTRVRYRIDGILAEKLSLPRSLQESLISRIKILSQMRIDERRIPQDGRFTFKIGEQEVDLRVSTLPTVHGEKIVMRLLKKTGGIPSLPDLGLQNVALRDLETAIIRPYGIILITGPTGSGKTTTLYSILSRLNQPGVNISTLEDPVEYEIPGINQVQINNQAGLTFSTGLRAFLRQDPNIILVGEIRDKETTTLAVQAALTGHLVFSTLHTNNASTAIPRLIDLGAEPFLITSILAAAIGQRIVRKICLHCKTSLPVSSEVDAEIKKTLGDIMPPEFRNKPIMVYKGTGCDECNHTGYFGRVGIYEVISVGPEVGRLILKQSTSADIETEARKHGMINMKQDGYLKVLQGVTTVEEVVRVAED